MTGRGQWPGVEPAAVDHIEEKHFKAGRRVAIALLHHPIRDRQGMVVTTNITNLDVHDIARAARTFGAAPYFVVHPMNDQLMYVDRMLDHWRSGEGSVLNHKRKTALTMVQPVASLEEAVVRWRKRLQAEGCEQAPRLVATHAKPVNGTQPLSFRAIRERIDSGEPMLVLLGTGFGLTDEFLAQCDLLLEPIRGSSADDYRHLSVRSAATIILDRLLGEW